MDRRYHILDVFTETRLAGNPLAVFLDGEGLDAAAMQAIAREFNLSETVFCTPPKDPVNTAAIRIFTPSAELPFAGHPTIGTAILLAKLNAPDLLASQDVGLVLEEAIGPVSCAVRHRRGEAPHARFDVPRLAERSGEAPPDADLATMLGLPPGDLGFGRHRPTRFSAGNAMTFVPLASIDALGRARLGDAMGDPLMLYLYTPAPDGGFRTRMLSRGYGVPEDPATGSAAAAFAGVLLANDALSDGEHDCVLHQGIEMGRPSRIGLAFTVTGGRLIAAAIGGHGVMVAKGTMTL